MYLVSIKLSSRVKHNLSKSPYFFLFLMKTWFEKSSKFSCVFILSLKLQLCLLVFVPFCMWACGEDAFLHFRKPQCLLHWARDGRVVAEEGKVKTQRHATWSGLWHVLFACERIKYLQNKNKNKKWIEQNSDRKENTIFQHTDPHT